MRIFGSRKEANMKTNLTGKDASRTHKSVSPEEIIAAGGTTAFGIKAGKNNETLKKALKKSPEPEPFTEEEWAGLLKQMANDK
jgi:hypothetical protein